MKHILVAYDGHEAGHRALEMAARLAHAFGARVDVVSVVPSDASSNGSSREPAMEHARELVEARGILRNRGVEAGLIEPTGDPAETIERLAAERGYDTIVVGASRNARDGKPWMASVTAHVAANARADVVVARRASVAVGPDE
jgi:nucleotide-binding universal stress UspA family protein